MSSDLQRGKRSSSWWGNPLGEGRGEEAVPALRDVPPRRKAKGQLKMQARHHSSPETDLCVAYPVPVQTTAANTHAWISYMGRPWPVSHCLKMGTLPRRLYRAPSWAAWVCDIGRTLFFLRVCNCWGRYGCQWESCGWTACRSQQEMLIVACQACDSTLGAC